MALYTLQPYDCDGPYPIATTAALEDDWAAFNFAAVVLDAHEGCSSVLVACGERLVLTRRRIQDGLGDVSTAHSLALS